MTEATPQQFVVQRLYVKDISLECPLGAAVFTKTWQPEVKVDLNVKNQKLGDDVYEVTLTITSTTKLGDDVANLVEVQQAGLFKITGFADEQIGPLLGIACPNLLYPYAREVVDNIVIKGGFPAIGLQPVNFEQLYKQQLERQQQQASH